MALLMLLLLWRGDRRGLRGLLPGLGLSPWALLPLALLSVGFLGLDGSFVFLLSLHLGGWAKSLGEWAKLLGDGLFVLSALVFSAYASLLLGKGGLYRWSTSALWSCLRAGIWANLLKVLFARGRPCALEGGFFRHGELISGGGLDWRYMSFPSGHASIAWALFFSALRGGAPRWAKLASFLFALLVSAGRLASADHWLSDVAFGLLLGELCAKEGFYDRPGAPEQDAPGEQVREG